MKRKMTPMATAAVFLMMFVGLLFPMTASVYAWETKDAQLAADWAAMMGFKAPDVVGKIAPEIKIGTVITAENYQQYPGLKELLPESLYSRLDAKAYAPLAPIKIAKTDQYHLSRGYLSKSQENLKSCKLAADKLTLEGYKGGFAFIHPKNGNELVQMAGFPYLGDSFAMRPMRLRLYNAKNQPERELRQHLNFLRYTGVTDWREGDILPNEQNIIYVVSGTFIYPNDLSGTSYVRTRYLSADSPDAFMLYIPSMRRTRRMSGRDTQDPLFGSDLVWDDYNVYWQKLSTKDFPCEYKIIKKTEMLLPTFIDYNWPQDREQAGYTDYRIDESGAQTYLHFGSWQRRPVQILEIKSLDPAYVYSRRVITFDAETYLTLQTDLYDGSGRLWRSWVRDYNLSQKGEGVMEDLIDIVDHNNAHRTILDFKGHMNPRWMDTEYADVRFLSRKSK